MGRKGKEEWLPKDESGVQKGKVGRLTLQEGFFFSIELRKDRLWPEKGGKGSRECQGRPPDLGQGTFPLDAR